MKGFEDIAIVDLDLAKTTWSRVHSSMRTLYLRLTREPELGWAKFFHEERESRIVLKRHGLWIEDGYIVFDCLLEDVEEHHLPDFRLSVAYANEKYRELLMERREQGEQMRDDARVEELELAALRQRIRIEGGVGAGPPPAVAAARSPRTNGAADAARLPVVVATPAPHTDDGVDTAPPPVVAAAPIPKWAQAIAAAKAAPKKFIAPDAKATRATPAAASAKITQPAAPPVAIASGGAPVVAAIQTDERPALDTEISVSVENPPATAIQASDTQQLPAATSTNDEPPPAVDSAAVTTPTPAAATAPAQEPANDANPDDAADFNAKREEWRARFRAALASRPKEPARGND